MGKSNSRLKVLFLPKWYPSPLDPQNGVFVKNHAKSVSAFAEVYVLYIQSDASITESYSVHISEGEFTEVTILYKPEKSFFGKSINPIRFLTATCLGYKLIRGRNFLPDICHVHIMTRPALLALMLKAVYNIPFIVTEHWTGYASGMYSKWPLVKKHIHKWLLERSTIITAVSESLKKTLSKITDKPIVVVPNVVGENFEYNQPNTSEKLIILTVADLDNRKKNVSDVIRVISEINKINKKFEYHIIGDGDDRKMLEAIAADTLEDPEIIIFHGRQENDYVAKFIKNADFIVINSNFETFCVIGIEALASGRPIIATRSGGPEEFVNEEFGILINPGDKQELKKGILHMLKSCREYDGKKMSSFIKQKYSKEKIGKLFSEVYSDTLKK